RRAVLGGFGVKGVLDGRYLGQVDVLAQECSLEVEVRSEGALERVGRALVLLPLASFTDRLGEPEFHALVVCLISVPAQQQTDTLEPITPFGALGVEEQL